MHYFVISSFSWRSRGSRKSPYRPQHDYRSSCPCDYVCGNMCGVTLIQQVSTFNFLLSNPFQITKLEEEATHSSYFFTVSL